VSAARNAGIKAVKADFISFLDADDEYKSEFLATVLNLREKYPGAGAYACAYIFAETDGRKMPARYKALPSFPWEGIMPDYFESALGQPPIWTSAVAVPKEIFTAVGCFPEGEKIGEDLDMWFRIALKYPIAFSSFTGAVYNRNAANRACDTYKTPNGYRLVETARDALANGKVPEKSMPFVKGIIDRQLLVSAAQCVLAGQRKKAREYLAQMQSGFFRKEKIYWAFLATIPCPLFKTILQLKRNL